MTTPAPKVGDRVDVTIRGAKVESTFNRGLFLDFGGETFIPMDNPSVTVTPHAAGEAEGLDLEAEDEIDNLKAVIETLHAQLDRLRAPAGIEAAIEAVKRLINDGDMGIVLHHHEIVAILRAAAVHLDAGRAGHEPCAEVRAAAQATVDALAAARARVADLEAELAEARGPVEEGGCQAGISDLRSGYQRCVLLHGHPGRHTTGYRYWDNAPEATS